MYHDILCGTENRFRGKFYLFFLSVILYLLSCKCVKTQQKKTFWEKNIKDIKHVVILWIKLLMDSKILFIYTLGRTSWFIWWIYLTFWMLYGPILEVQIWLTTHFRLLLNTYKALCETGQRHSPHNSSNHAGKHTHLPACFHLPVYPLLLTRQMMSSGLKRQKEKERDREQEKVRERERAR